MTSYGFISSILLLLQRTYTVETLILFVVT